MPDLLPGHRVAVVARSSYDRGVTRLTITQRIHPVSTRYVVEDGVGNEVCHVKAKRFKLREELVLWRDDGERTPYASIKARSVVDFGGVYDVREPDGDRLVGSLQRQGVRSMLRGSWSILGPGGETIATVAEDSMALALLRRMVGLPLPITYSVTGADGTALGTHKRRFGIRDRYDLDVEGIDERLLVALGVGLDLLESR